MALVNEASWLDQVEWKLDHADMTDSLQIVRDMVRRDTERFIANHAERETFPVTTTVSAHAPEPADRQAIMNIISQQMALANDRPVTRAIHGEWQTPRTDATDRDLRKAVEELSEQIRDLIARADAQEKQIEELTEALAKSNPNYGRF